jgi:hypothetical protein
MKNNKENVIRENKENIKVIEMPHVTRKIKAHIEVIEMPDGRKLIIPDEKAYELFQDIFKETNNVEFEGKKYWDDTYQYYRILEILHDYWLTEKDEAFVKVDMEFRHADGQEQFKCIRWWNPNID